MASHRLPNYLKAYRKRDSLTQDDVAFLLGCRRRVKVSRHECLVRQPNLETALGYEAVFGIPARELFAGVYEKVEDDIRKRARTLSGKLGTADSNQKIRRKLARLKAIATSTKQAEPAQP
jgi:DNA-binding XRE family transcriptional regulator